MTKKTAVKGVPIQILNGTAVAGLGAQVGVSLKGQGYTVVGAPANASNPDFTTTVIYYEAGAKDLVNSCSSTTFTGPRSSAPPPASSRRR